jgi:hypothetical protein
LLHHAPEDEHQLEHQTQHHGELEKLSARHRHLLDGKAVDFVERLQLFLHVRFPPAGYFMGGE